MQRLQVAVVAAALSLLGPVAATGQDVGSGTFVGIARDASGAVLPGVTVEATSPALIEKVRTTVTDSAGRYRITGLRPGPYSVTFSLAGFRTVRREGIELTTGFVATVDGELSVGAVEETITVSGQAPLVDTRNSSQQQVFSGDMTRALPVGKSSALYVALLPGAVQNNLTSMDVGGTKAEAEGQVGIHGGRPNDGVRFREGNFDGHMFGGFGASAVSSINPATVQEVTLQLSGGLTAEAQTGGIQSNVILRDGGNAFRGTLIADFAHRNLQADNVDEALQRRGVQSTPRLDKNYDVAIGVGGPLRPDRLWYFVDARKWDAYSEYPGSYYNSRQGTMFYEPDLGRPGISGVYTESMGARLTWQASQRDKINFTYHYDDTCTCFYQLAQGLRSPEAAEHHRYYPYRIGQVNWTNPITSRLLLQVGTLFSSGTWDNLHPDASVTNNDISILDRSRNFRYNASDNLLHQPFSQSNISGSASYLAGAHAFKVGGLYLRASRTTVNQNNQSLSYTFNGIAPESVTYYAYPSLSETDITQSAIYAQDQWTIRDLTVNLGLRLDMFSAHAPASRSPEGRWVPAREFAAVDTVTWRDTNIRLGAAYNLFGSNRTAVKANLGRFIPYEQTGGTGGVISGTVPANQLVLTANRTWRDASGDYVPQEAELGPLSNSAFGTIVRNTAYADDVVRGWHVRPYSWQGSVSVQHEIRSGVGLNVGYYRTWYGNFTVTDNMLVSAADYDSYCIPGPSDSRLPGGGAGQICGLMGIRPALFGRVSNLVARASDYGSQTEVYNGIDLTLNLRIGAGGLLAGGLSTSQTVTDNCEVRAQVPESAPTAAPLQFCRNSPPWSAGTQLKLYGSYPLPWNFRASAVYQDVVGAPTTATYVANNAQVTPFLGRPLAGGAGTTASVELIEPKTTFEDGRVRTINLSFSRAFRMGSRRVEPTLSLHNAFNANSVLQTNLRYGPSWRNVTSTLPPRMIKFGVVVDF